MKKVDAKDKLLEAAERCLMEKGSHAASVKAIAAMADVNHGLVHHYFGSKEGLFIELAKEHLKITTPLKTVATENEVIDFLEETVFFYSRMMVELRALSYQMPELNNVLINILKERRKNLQEILNIDDEQAVILISSVAGLAFQAGLDTSMKLKDALRKVFNLIN
ncbi:MAG: helix-turn-helix domain containing protein [Spirochaetales bacterium]|uniref:Helix-turn-helix domain containing protein n=1 Tax=Candidatus Thalassospirochaeta sargassi TaxID=3119039 RepID=A0AAJ1IFS5_9SPIO|nr:helix-turn-helix domain containing protein [Spirochaetales bacterium]